MTPNPIWTITKQSPGPIFAVALHTAHAVRKPLEKRFKIDPQTRLREEDPFTGAWVDIGDTGIVATRSRFEVDLNRPREKAVYLCPEDAWGLPVWKVPLPPNELHASLAEYNAFYTMLVPLLKAAVKKHGCFFIYDLHSYNHRREGPNHPPAPQEENPEVNIGTGTMKREQWAPLIDGLIDELRQFDFLGRNLDVRENIKFKGGGFPAFIHEHFPETGCVVSIEFKKFWMDEWAGTCNRAEHAAIRSALASTVAGVRERLAAR